MTQKLKIGPQKLKIGRVYFWFLRTREGSEDADLRPRLQKVHSVGLSKVAKTKNRPGLFFRRGR